MIATDIIKNNRGVTLVEVVISTAVLAIGIFSLYSMQIGAMSGNSKSMLLTESANVARAKIEELIGLSYSDSALSDGTHTETVSSSAITSIAWTVTSWRNDGVSNDGDTKIDEFDERGIKTVSLAVNYRSKGVAKSTRVNFLKSEIF